MNNANGIIFEKQRSFSRVPRVATPLALNARRRREALKRRSYVDLIESHVCSRKAFLTSRIKPWNHRG